MREYRDHSGRQPIDPFSGQHVGSFRNCAVWVLCLLILSLAGRSSVRADDWQYRVNGQITANLAEDFKATFINQSRYDDTGSFFYQYSDMGLAYTGLADWLDVSINYKVIFAQQTNDTWTYGTLPHLNATFRFPLFGITFSDRLRLEYSNLHDLTDYGTVRNKLSVNPPIYLDPLRERARKHNYKLRPFGSYEFFYNTDSGKIVRNEFAAGLSMSFTERVIGDLYYMRQENAVDADSDLTLTYDGLNIAGFKLRLLF